MAKSEEAQSLDVTQNMMKNLTDMVSYQSQLESGSYEQLQQQSATANLIGANISGVLDKGNRVKHTEAGPHTSLLHTSAFFLTEQNDKMEVFL